TGNDSARRDLESIGSPPYRSVDAIGRERRWALRAAAQGGNSVRLDDRRLLLAGGYDRADSTWAVTTGAVSAALMAELWALNADPDAPRLRVPLLIIAGGHDGHVRPDGLRPGFERYGGRKRLVVFEAADHFPYVSEPDRFARAVIGFLISHDAARR